MQMHLELKIVCHRPFFQPIPVDGHTHVQLYIVSGQSHYYTLFLKNDWPSSNTIWYNACLNCVFDGGNFDSNPLIKHWIDD